MAYLEVNLDPFISLENIVKSPLTNPLHLLSSIESIGVGGISFTYREELFSVKDTEIFRKMTDSRINIRVIPDVEPIRNALLLKPDMITIINPSNSYKTLEIPSQRIKELINMISGNHDIGLSLRLEPDIKQLKEAYQLGVDEVEVATNQLSTEKLHTDFFNTLQTITHCIKVGTKNNLRVSIGGDLNPRILHALKELIEVEFISIGNNILSQTLVMGFEQTIRNISQIIEIK